MFLLTDSQIVDEKMVGRQGRSGACSGGERIFVLLLFCLRPRTTPPLVWYRMRLLPLLTNAVHTPPPPFPGLTSSWCM
jgi:hypothetical protein